MSGKLYGRAGTAVKGNLNRLISLVPFAVRAARVSGPFPAAWGRRVRERCGDPSVDPP